MILACMRCAGSVPPDGKQGKSMAGIDVSTVSAYYDIRIGFSHAISERWTAGGTVCIGTGIGTRKDKSTEKAEHELEFADEDSVVETAGRPGHSESAVMQFWPRKAYDGMFFLIGGRHSNERKVECILGLGYLLPLWKGLAATVSVETGIGRTADDGRRAALGICYIF